MTGRKTMSENPLKVIRRAAKMTQQQLAFLAGISQQTVVAVEWGVFLAPPPAQLEVLAKELLSSRGDLTLSPLVMPAPPTSPLTSPQLQPVLAGHAAQTEPFGVTIPLSEPFSAPENMASDQAKAAQLAAVTRSLHALWKRWVKAERISHRDDLIGGRDFNSFDTFMEYRQSIEERLYTYARLLVFDQRTLDLYEKHGYRKDTVFAALSDVLYPEDLAILQRLPHA